ncbi:hypothetical protein K435DRAFT_961576 [Dendrothele bispora CBS 962.96]|uniref:Uncharacterized protein n=1 Tax=Dendrothele bispora (strain CBS 962.96) TaxID=1314807 RepID=A0A4S8MPD2_DENBC|nr:hypothetical protein K435DRAFT_961576 [Dendrothele bispora CBS 962.96]
MDKKGQATLEPNSRRPNHHPSPSLDTNASALAESTISFSQFPAPPASIPTTPIASPIRAEFAHSSNRNRSSPSASPKHRPSVPPPRSVSSHDWHEGASSIDVDAAEDRLLSTSFITSLLKDSPEPGLPSRRTSITSDAMSGFSEMTYPPPNRTVERPPLPSPSSSRPPPPRPSGARPPPSSFPVPRTFSVIPESSGFVSDDSDTLYSTGPDDPTIIRSASMTRGPRIQGVSVVGVAPARLHSITSSNWRPSTIASSEDDKAGYAGYSNTLNALPYSPALPSTAIHSGFFEKPQSVRSTKSFATSVISRISSAARSVNRALPLPWRRLKPLPPVPIIPHIPVATERDYQREESSLPLPSLVTRASTLNGMLEKGYHPHHSLTSYHKHETIASGREDTEAETLQRRRETRSTMPWSEIPSSPKPHRSRFANKKRYLIILAIFVIVAAAAVGAGVGVSINHKSSEKLPVCSSSNITGQNCDLAATCICTSDSSCQSQSQSIAKSIIDIVPTMNELFSTEYSNASVYSSLWFAVGSPTGDSCASQALLIDVGPALSSAKHPNRTRWAQTALLWNIVQSQNTSATQQLQNFIKAAPWSQIDSSDGPVDDQSSSFSISVSGFTFNFASQNVSPQSVEFVDSGQPTSDQISRVGNTALQTLNRMYSFAHASSTQQELSLSSYWTSVLQQKSSDLNKFTSAIISSPVLLTFDASFEGLSNLMTNSSTNPFPPPLSCYPDLNSTLTSAIDSVEQSVYGLSAVQTTSKFDASCYPDRPIYGVLDVLRLQLPFVDTSSNTLPKQAAVLDRDANPRAILRNGKLLSALPDSFDSSVITSSSLNPRSYGTMSSLNHVLLAYLSSISNVNVTVAQELVAFLLSSNTQPPSNDSTLGQSLSSIPSLEVAVFGSVLPADIDHTVSSFSTSNGSLFFGSVEGEAFREWTISGTGSRVNWAENALSTSVAQDSSLSDDTFNNIWNNASVAIQHDLTTVGVSNITTALRVSGKLSSP